MINLKHYFISKKEYNGEVICINYDKLIGYKFTPKKDLIYDGIKVNEMIIIKPSLIEKVIKRKIKNKLDWYLKLVVENLDGDNDDDTRIALGDIQRYKKVINERYSIYLDEQYITLLNKKMNVIERELKNSLIYKNHKEDSEIDQKRCR